MFQLHEVCSTIYFSTPIPTAATDSQEKAKSNIWHLFPVQYNLPGSLTFFM